jgi:hypothetical protein
VKRVSKITLKKKLTLEMAIEKLDAIIRKLDVIENDLREIKTMSHRESEEEKEPRPEFFMEK